MKNIIKFLERPKVIIPTFLVVAVIIGAVSYRFVGQAPNVNLADPIATTTVIYSANDSVDLAFPKSGRLISLSIELGTQVKKGEVLASLDAGDALGAVNQAKGALELAKAQYASLDVQYANTKNQQDVLVNNAYRTLLSSSLAAVARNKSDNSIAVVDNNQFPAISGTYSCNKEGNYEIDTYASGAESGYSFTYSGIESGMGNVTYYTPQSLGSCGFSIQFPVGFHSDWVHWEVSIPNKDASSYVSNKNAYDIAVANRDQVLKQLEANLGKDGSASANVAQAGIDSAEGAYEIALAAYKNSLIISPVDGVVTFVDSHLKVGQAVTANKTVISISNQ